MSDRVRIEIEAGVADVRLNRPDKLNALDPAMLSALRSLGTRDLELVTLVVLEDLSLAEAGLALGISPSAAKARMHRSRTRLREQLGDAVLDPTAPAGGTA